MKRIFYILLIVPLFGFSQTQVDCSLLTVTDVVFQNDSITFEIFNADTVDSHYPYVAYTLDASGDTIQNGQMNYYMTFAGTSSTFLYTHNLEFGPLNLPSIMYPLSIYFTYSNLTGENPEKTASTYGIGVGGNLNRETTYEFSVAVPGVDDSNPTKTGLDHSIFKFNLGLQF